MTTVGQTMIGAVPTFWVETGRDTLAATLVFRAGMVDETLKTRGWIHVLEHLALHDRESGTLHVNGSVGLLTTRFDVHGPVHEVVAALAGIADWLANPVLDRLDHEARVLRAEADLRQVGEVGAALPWRYGAAGPGLAGYGEFGLNNVDPDRLRPLLGRLFTAGNAALVLDGPPPDGLTLPLAGGERHPLPTAHSCAQTLPLGYVIRSGITLSGDLPRTDAAMLVPMVLREHFHRTLREEAGGAYAPWAHYEAVDADRAIAFVGSDLAAHLRPTVVSQVVEDLARLSSGDGLEELLDHVRAGYLQAIRDPYNLVGLAMGSAAASLHGRPMSSTLQERIDEVAAVTVTELADHVAMFHSSLLLGVEGKVSWPATIPMAQMPTRPLERSRRFRLRAYPQGPERLVVSDTSLQLGQVGTELGAQTIEYAAVAAVLAVPDGGRQLIDRDGWGLTVEPTFWRDGARAVRELDARLPPAAYVRLPERTTVPQPDLPTLGTHVLGYLTVPWIYLPVSLVVALLIIAGFVAMRFTSGQPALIILLIAMTIGGHRWAVREYRRRQRQ